VALSMTVVACGGDVDDGKPAATGGAPNSHYGPALVTGGATGAPGTSGIGGGYYGPKGFGGASSETSVPTGTGTGGSSPIDAGAPATGGFYPIPIYAANLRLPASSGDPQTDQSAIAFEPNPAHRADRG
jgi:hypothetical protein